MEVFYAVIKILAGCGAFLLGFKLLSDNMEKIAGNRLKSLFNKTSEKKMVGVGMGVVTTAVVQSSSITTVMVVGFVNAGIMSLNQAAAVIMGANVGTTITAQIVALQSFQVDTLFMAFTAVGVFMEMFSKNDRVKSCGLALAGLGLVFMGLSVMSGTMKGYAGNESVQSMLQTIKKSLFIVGRGLVAYRVGTVLERGDQRHHHDGGERTHHRRGRKRASLYYSRLQHRHLRNGAHFVYRRQYQRQAGQLNPFDVQCVWHFDLHDSVALLADLSAEYV